MLKRRRGEFYIGEKELKGIKKEGEQRNVGNCVSKDLREENLEFGEIHNRTSSRRLS